MLISLAAPSNYVSPYNTGLFFYGLNRNVAYIFCNPVDARRIYGVNTEVAINLDILYLDRLDIRESWHFLPVIMVGRY